MVEPRRENLNFQDQTEKEIKSIWVYKQRDSKSGESNCSSSDGISEEEVNSDSDLFDLDIEDTNYLINEAASKPSVPCAVPSNIPLQRLNLAIVPLDSISIKSSNTTPIPQILNLKQSFTFPPILKPLREISTQTSKIQLNLDLEMSLLQREKSMFVCNKNIIAGSTDNELRPKSLPSDAVLPTSFFEKCLAGQNIVINAMGDGIEKTIQEVKPLGETLENGMRKPDLELANVIPPNSVNKAVVKPKKPTRLCTPLVNKKFVRPQTKRKPRVTVEPNSQTSASSSDDIKNKNIETTKKVGGISTNQSMDFNNGNYNVKLSGVVDKLQDHSWEICLDGLREFVRFAGNIEWEEHAKYIPIISRKLIDFFRSPRSNLCRTACQTAGEFFMMAKSTKRPEFDEMVDILLSRTADPNRFIQKDSNVALDKMVQSICIQHSVRAICAKGPDHKNPIVRATAARLLANVCKQAGNDQIIGAEANPRTRKRILAVLAKFLLDKNQETRKHAEKLCKTLKRHKFFMEYFFKDVENNFKNPLRKILNSIDCK
ncbi:unnamed protein product [Diamesa hyperborea]